MSKTKIKEVILAAVGGKPHITEKGPHYSWPPVTTVVMQKLLRQAVKALSIYDRSGIFAEFEDLFAEMHGRKRALLTSSGTAAIHSMFYAAGFKAGDEVIAPAYTFFATVTPLLFTGAVPVLCDSDENGNIDPTEIERKITPRTKGVIVTHMWGVPCQMDKILSICRRHKLLLLEDCSHAHGGTYKGKPLGSFGHMAAWSIQGAKNVSGGEGGVFATDVDDFYYKALIFGHYNKRCKQEIPETHPLRPYATTGAGLKFRAHPLAVAVAFECLKKLPVHVKQRQVFAEMMTRQIGMFPGLRPPKIPSGSQASWYNLVFQYRMEDLDGLPIDRFFEALKAEGLAEVDRPMSTSPLNLLPLFQRPEFLFPQYNGRPFSYRPGDFPNAERFYKNAIKVPVWAFPRDVGYVEAYIEAIQKVLIRYKQLL